MKEKCLSARWWWIVQKNQRGTALRQKIPCKMMFGMPALSDDTTSRSSSLHLFLDSTCNDYSEVATGSFSSSERQSHEGRASIPHIFLSYAKPGQYQRLRRSQKTTPSFVPSKKQDDSVVSSPEWIELPLYAKTNRRESKRLQHKNKHRSTDASQSTSCRARNMRKSTN